MARKTTGTGTSSRVKKNAASVPTVAAQRETEMNAQTPEVSASAIQESQHGKSSSPVPINQHSPNFNAIVQQSNPGSASQSSSSRTRDTSDIEAEIRQRAYEIYLERQSDGSSRGGDPHQDWLTAEREIRSRANNRERKSA